MPRKELFNALAKEGLVIHGKDPEMVLSTMLWRASDTIVRLPPHGYWPKDTPFSPAQYDPDFDALFGPASTEPEGEIDDGDTDEDHPDDKPLI